MTRSRRRPTSAGVTDTVAPPCAAVADTVAVSAPYPTRPAYSSRSAENGPMSTPDSVSDPSVASGDPARVTATVVGPAA